MTTATAELRAPECVNLHGTDVGDRDCLSHSRLGTFLACEEKFRWSYVERLEPAVKKTSLRMGGAFAHATEVGDPQAGCDMLLAEYAAMVDEYSGNPWVIVPTRQEAETEATTVLAASNAYLDRFGARAKREVEMRARIRNPATGHYSRTFDVQARVDGIEDDTLIEDKLQAKVEKTTEAKLVLDRQVTLGTYLHWRTTGQQIQTIKYRITKKPSIKQTQKETHDQFLERLVKDYAARPDFYVFEFELTRSTEDFLRLERELWRWCEQIRGAVSDGVFPRNVASCSEYGGCPMLALCTRQPGASEQYRIREERPKSLSSNTSTTEVVSS